MAASAAMCCARSASSAPSRSTARGVNPREMILRSRVCSGSSIMIIDSLAALTWPLTSTAGLKCGTTVLASDENTSLRSDTSRTSWCLLTTQKPPSPNPPTSGGCSFYQIGAARRTSANSSVGSRVA